MHRALRLAPALLALLPLRAVAQQAPTPAPAAAAAPAHAVPAKSADFYDEQADGKTLIAAALKRATKENRRVLIQWGANWCGWCHQLHDLFASDKDLARELLYEYDVVNVDIGKFNKHLDLAAGYGADVKSGVPFLTVLAADGSVLANQETGSLERGAGQPGHDPAKVLVFLKSHQASPLVAEDLRRAALARAGQEGKSVFLHFGAPWCGWCHKLEDWMARDDVAALLGKGLVDCKIDVDRTTGGAAMLTAARGSDQGGIPWFEIVAADGTVLATSNGEHGNIGFPSAPEEIAHFREMLGKAGSHLAADDIAKLVASLQPAPAPAAPVAH